MTSARRVELVAGSRRPRRRARGSAPAETNLSKRDDLHVERLGALGDELADAAEADHAERLAVELVAAVARARPLAADERAVRLGDVAAQRERQRQRVLGGGDRVRLGRVGDDDPALGRGVHVDVVDAGAGAADHLQAAGAPDQLRRSSSSPSGSGSRRTRRSARSSSPSSQSRPSSTSKSRAQQVDARVGDLLLDQDPRDASVSVRSPLTVAPRHVLDHPVDAGGERLDVGGLDRREHPDPQLVAPELAVGLGVDDPVRAQGRGERRGVDAVVEVDRADDERALRRVGDERGREVARLGPAVEVARRGAASARRTSRGPPDSSIHSTWSASSSSVATAGVL